MNSRLIISKSKAFKKTILCLIAITLIHFPAFAGETITPSETVSVLFNPLFIAMMIIAILLLIAIIIFAEVIKAAAYSNREKEKLNGPSQTGKIILLILFMGTGSSQIMAQSVSEPVLQQTANSCFGLNATIFYMMLSLIGLEVFIAASLYSIAKYLLNIDEIKEKKQAEKAKAQRKQPTLIEKLNASVAIEKEQDIMLDHDYDGIRELDNNLPPWWKYGFYLTILFSVVYLIHFHISNTGKLQVQEYEDQLTEAKLQMEEYKKKAANLVDENNAILLKDEATLSSGKSVFMDNCAACHGRSGEGGVGPNLTDDYWLHEGGVKSIFKSIKYGWPEKGMKSWQQDLGAKQIHEITCYIMSLHGTNPANAKEKQGELYTEKIVSDSIHVDNVDSLKIEKGK